jgi:DNA-binding PadR family transcriptional regulator
MVKKDIWDKLAKNYETVRNAEVANSLLCTLTLAESDAEMSTSQISEDIARKTKGQIFKIPSTLKSTLELMRNLGLVDGRDLPNAKKSLYKINPKGARLLKAWTAFLEALG